MDMDYEMELDMDGSGEIEDDIMFESLESIDETDFGTLEPIENTLYDEFNDSEIPEYSMDIFSDTALTEIELDDSEFNNEAIEELGSELNDEIIKEYGLNEGIETMIDSAANIDGLNELKDYLVNIESENEMNEDFDGDDSPKVLTREITPEILESRERDTDEVLDNYRENLRGYGVEEEKIEEFINHEREKINAEYESLDKGDISSNTYYQPENWEDIAASLTDQSMASEYQEMEATDTENLGQETEQMSDEIGEQNIDYTEIYDEIQQEALEQGFEDFQIDADPERLENSLENFDKAVWDTYSLEEQKDSMKDLADYVVDVIGFDNPPRIDYYNNEQEGDFGGYDSATNTLHINEYMLYNSNEAADTIAHELWHAHQHECATDPHCARDYQYQYNFENYIPPALGQEAYEAQLVEAEARAFAAQFKDRLEITKGRSR